MREVLSSPRPFFPTAARNSALDYSLSGVAASSNASPHPLDAIPPLGPADGASGRFADTLPSPFDSDPSGHHERARCRLEGSPEQRKNQADWVIGRRNDRTS